MHEYNQGELLKDINFPEDIKKLPKEKLPQLCNEVREYIIEVLAENPGHLGSSLGTVELTVALHYVYDVPNDSLIWALPILFLLFILSLISTVIRVFKYRKVNPMVRPKINWRKIYGK